MKICFLTLREETHGDGRSSYEVDLIFEFCENNLRKECTEGFEPKIIQDYTQQLLEAVEYMHQRGWVHRDIKPGNIFLKQSRNAVHGWVVKLGDLGSAHLIDTEATTAESGAIGDKGCTVIYAAPEVLKNESAYGRKSDIWSIGI